MEYPCLFHHFWSQWPEVGRRKIRPSATAQSRRQQGGFGEPPTSIFLAPLGIKNRKRYTLALLAVSCKHRNRHLCKESSIALRIAVPPLFRAVSGFSIPTFRGKIMSKKQLWRGGELMINIAICDDEVYMLNLLTEKVLGFFKQENMEIAVFPFQSGKALLDCDKKLDIVFLDIQMGEPNGLETAKELRSRGYGGFLIFITVLQEYVFNAFEVQAFDYLVKPLQEDNFSRTMGRLLLSIRSHKEKQLLIQKGTEWSIVPFDDIVYCEIINRKVYLHLKDEPVLDYYDKIETLERKLDERFFKCHRSYLINLQYLKSYKAGQAYLTNGETIPVSRLRGDEFSTVILQYMKEQGHRNG